MTDNILKIRSAAETKWDCVAFGEVMLRLDPGFGRPALDPAGFTGQFSNINLSNQTQLDHGNIDNAPQLQQFVYQQIFQITHTHAQTRVAKRKTTRKG